MTFSRARLAGAALFAAAMLLPALTTATTAAPAPLAAELREWVPDPDAWCEIRQEWIREILDTYPVGAWAPMKWEPTDDQLARLGLPDRAWLTSHEFDEPTAILPDGAAVPVAMPKVASFAGTGCFGLRPGAFLLLLDGGSVGWCSMAHVYGSPGNYKISTAGHCAVGQRRAIAIGAIGDGIPVLLEFGRYSGAKDGGIGNDLALIDVFPEYQPLVSPTMCFWGGPLGMYERTGAVATARWLEGSGRISPGYTVTPDPFLAQTIVHYGHGAGLGPGGTPRVGEAVHWGASHFTFFGAISPGDSGSGSNALQGDGLQLGSVNEAAGINTHIYVDPTLETGLGLMAGTRATKVSGTLAHGQVVPYPAPVPGAP